MMNSQNDKFIELISLTEHIASFHRFHANSVQYHHWHQCVECLYVEEGYGVVMVNNQQYTMRPGRLFVFPPFTLHKVMVDDSQTHQYRRTVYHVDQQALAALLTQFPHHRQQLLHLASRQSAASVFDMDDKSALLNALFMHYEALFQKQNQTAELAACLFLQLLNLLPNLPVAADSQQDELSTQVMHWIECQYHEKFSLSRLAKELGYSNSYVSRRFHQEMGETIQDYLLTFRLRKACELLRHSELSIDAIAVNIGFSSNTYFISSFRHCLGDTPLQYRKRYLASLAESDR
ncbi:AraC family transcriptional regulator [Vibrio furnissii]|uniref:AraC family transcriptional regulator n=1 Tax=Vibrio furnissii TaxID=29494 RepID=UPI001E64560B|nr:AraC family transcriptional regulator [Vibrio furnissii]UHJ61122.1 AraC family transcriptional regulator [Vibrio furnissii]